MSLLVLLLLCLFTFLILLYIYMCMKYHRNEVYFKRHSIPYIKLGYSRVYQLFRGIVDSVTMEKGIYKEALETKSPLVGMSDLFGKPNVYITDLDLVRNVFVKDFDHFVNRRPIPSSGKYFEKGLLLTKDQEWKDLRARLSPCFTTGRIKKLSKFFLRSSGRMSDYLKREMIYPENVSLDLNFLELFPKYCMDVIASCAFGIDSESFSDTQSTFIKMANQFENRTSLKFFLKAMLIVVAPKVAKYFEIDFFDSESQAYLVSVIKQQMKTRRESGEKKDDFLQLMMDAQEGLLKRDQDSQNVMNGVNFAEKTQEKEWNGEGDRQTKFDDDDIVANGLLFLVGGLDPTVSVLILTCYALALETEVQEKVSKEVRSAMDRNGGKLTYDAISEMKYLDMVINEAMRRHAPAGRAERLCTKDYPVPGTDFVIEKGFIVLLPVQGAQQDPQYFPEPEKFIPERFTAQNKAERHPYAFMPFGHGPRNCIGMRFAFIMVKTAVAHLISTFQFVPCSKTPIPIEFGFHPNLRPKKDMWLNVTARES